MERFRHLLFLVRVEGESAWPELIPTKHYFATNLLPLRLGDFVVFKDPGHPERTLVKKVFSQKKGSFVAGSIHGGVRTYAIKEADIVGKVLRTPCFSIVNIL